MVDAVAIIIAVVSLVGSLIATAFTGWITYYVDHVKERTAAQALTDKYRSPLALSAYELQSRLYNLIELGLLNYLGDDSKDELVVLYTCFLIGQYLSWVHILHRQAQFLRFTVDPTNRQLYKILADVARVFNQDVLSEEFPFMLWRGEQTAIGEIMTLREEEGQLYCIGYAAFRTRYREDAAFSQWFAPIERSIPLLAAGRLRGNPAAANRLRRLQHLLMDLVLLIGSDLTADDQYPKTKVPAAPLCTCSGIACAGKRLEKASQSG